MIIITATTITITGDLTHYDVIHHLTANVDIIIHSAVAGPSVYYNYYNNNNNNNNNINNNYDNNKNNFNKNILMNTNIAKVMSFRNISKLIFISMLLLL